MISVLEYNVFAYSAAQEIYNSNLFVSIFTLLLSESNSLSDISLHGTTLFYNIVYVDTLQP